MPDYLTGLVQEVAPVTHLAGLLNQLFGQGYHDDERGHQPFSRTDTLARLARGSWLSGLGGILFETWPSKDNGPVVTLCYGADRELLLSIKQRPALVPDVAVRNKGTVADLLRLRLGEVLQQPELRKEVNLKEGRFNSVLYEFALAEPELGVFDRAEVRMFEPERVFTHDTEVNLTLASSVPIPGDKLVRIAEQLIRLYGAEQGGAAELVPYEVEDLHGRWWTGRMWQFTERHTLWQIGGSERMAYGVNLYMHKPGRLEMTIHGYNKLLELFTA